MRRLGRSFLFFWFVVVSVVANGQFLQVVHRTVIDVEVDLAGDAVDGAHVGVLPEFPLTVEAELLHIVVGNPEGIAIELRRAEISLLELQSGVDDGGRAEASFHEVEPLEGFFSQRFGRLVADFLNVEHGGEVALLELDVVHEIACLPVARDVGREIVIGSTDEAVLSRFPEVALKISIQMAFSLGGFDEDKFHAGIVGNGGGGYLVPIDGALVVAHIDAVDAVVVRQFRLAEDGAPTIAVGSYEKVVEEQGVDQDDGQSTDPKGTFIFVAERTFCPRE